MKRTITMALGLAAASALAGGSVVASASSSGPNLSNSKPSYVSDAKAPVVPPRVFAVVNSNGTIVRGKGLLSVTKLGTGVYDVRFVRNITPCSWLGTVGFGQFSGSTGPAMITITGRVTTNNGLFVTTFNSAGGAADFPFHADVICA